MESGVAGYLHKKFKKQSTIDYKIFKCDTENGKKEQCNTVEEPRIGHEVRKESSVPDCIADNNAKESDESTNQNSVLNFSYCNNATSSISVKSNTQSTGPCISYVETFRTDDRYSPRTDRTYYDRFTAPDSSVATTAYSKDACSPHKEDISYNNNTSRFITNDETLVPLTDLKSHDGSLKSGDSNSKYEETPALQDKPTGGKYVCTYCNLGCSKPSVLQKHIRAHTNERPYPCISCGFSFKTRSNLYKHCRSRTHANRVMGNKVQEIGTDEKNADHKFSNNSSSKSETEELAQDLKLKPYKPRFHNAKEIAVSRDSAMDRHDESSLDELNNTDSLSHHINEIISKNNSIVHSNNHFVPKLLYPDEYQADYANSDKRYDEPLNLTNKNRKRCVSEVQEPITQKSLIKELLLKNLYAETMQCRYCKMIFQTVTELELHKLRSCKGFTKPGLKYTRSSSVNVASILTQNKNAFDDIPQLQNSMFPLKSPGPFLGNIRLVDREKTKSFSYEDVQADTFSAQSSPGHAADRYLWGLDLQTERDRKPTVKLFGGEVKIANTSSECYKMDSKVHETFNSSSSSPNSKLLIEDKLSKNHVVKSGLQSGGTVLTNKTHYSKQDSNNESEGMNIYKPTSSVVASEPCDGIERNFSFNPTSSRDTTPTITIQVPYEIPNKNVETTPSYSCLNIVDFSQKALKMLTPNIKRPNLNIINASKPVYDDLSHNSSHYKSFDAISKQSDNFVYENKLKKHNNTFDPMHLVVNGRVVRYVPGMPGPVIADEPVASESYPVIDKPKERDPSVSVQSQANTVKEDKIKNFQPPINFSKPEIESKIDPSKSLAVVSMNQIDQTKFSEKVPQTKFARPNSLALKPSSVSLKQHHGLTPTMFNQILISPDTPRVAKKYVQQFLHGNYFSYLGLKSTTKPVYCTLNKTQPFYTPHFKKLSMYSEWRQQDNKTDKLFVSSYDSRQRQQRYSMAGKAQDLIVHSSYKFILTEVVSSKQEKCDDKLNSNSTTGTCGYESKEDYTYIRGRGRGRYVCDQCGIRCKKPSMLKKHIKTHSDDRPYTCSHCNFSFKTKGNLTKHMKSKVHTKNSTSGSGNSSSSQQNLTQSSESESEDSDAESSDESTRQQEHEAAYGLLTLAQKTTTGLVPESQTSPVVSNLVDSGPIHSIPDMLNIMDTEEIVHVTKINYAKNKILDQQNNYNFSSHKNLLDNETKYAPHSADETSIARPLTYPYTSVSFSEEQVKCPPAICPVINSAEIHGDSLSQFPETTQHLSDMKRSRSQSVGDSFHRANLRESYDYEESGMMSVDRANSFSGYKEIDDRKKRKIDFDDSYNKNKVQKSEDVMDLSIGNSDHSKSNFTENEGKASKDHSLFMETRDDYVAPRVNCSDEGVLKLTNYQRKDVVNTETSSFKVQETHGNFEPESSSIMQYDNSAMETLADIATKQDKLEKNTLAKSVATEYLKLATKNEYPSGNNANIINIPKDVNELIVKPEGSKSCSICSKSFSKSSQLKLHMNIHYIERPYRCESCSVSFRSKGHLQKHERSASHHNKLTSSPAQVSSEPRPFKCLDCKIAFRIPGHLAKHLRSKMHIMKLECLARIPFGLYAELERSNNLLTEINTVDGDQCLESLRVLAKKIFFNDPNKLNQLECPEEVDTNS